MRPDPGQRGRDIVTTWGRIKTNSVCSLFWAHPSRSRVSLPCPDTAVGGCSLSLQHKLISNTPELYSNHSHAYCYIKIIWSSLYIHSSWLGCIDILVIHTSTITLLTVVPASSAFEEPTENLKYSIVKSQALWGQQLESCPGPTNSLYEGFVAESTTKTHRSCAFSSLWVDPTQTQRVCERKSEDYEKKKSTISPWAADLQGDSPRVKGKLRASGRGRCLAEFILHNNIFQIFTR